MIELKNVSKYYHNGETTNLGLHNISLRFEKNEIVAITGDSGSGKSTLLNVITKIDTFDEGEIYYRGNETSYFSIADMDDFRKNKIGFIFQNYNIIDSYTVLENVMLPLTLKGITGKEAKDKALELIDKVGLKDRAHSRGTKLSGGEKQRCVIARALASDCEILACDEPTGNLDSKTGDDIIKLIQEVSKDKLVLIVTHNFDQVQSIVTRKIRVTDGEITEDEVYSPVPQDEDKELDLDYVPLKKRVCGRVARNNILFTPKKTILLGLIFLAICFATLFMFQSIFSSFTSLDTSPVYLNASKNRLVAYSMEHTKLNEADFTGLDYDKNAFAEDQVLPIDYSIESNYTYTVYSVYSDRYSYSLAYGAKPSKDNEVVILLDRDSYLGYFVDENSIGKKLSVSGSETQYVISGIAYGKNNDPVLTGCPKLKKEMTTKIVADNAKVSINGSMSATMSQRTKKDQTTQLIVPTMYKGQEIKLYIFGAYDITNTVTITYSDEYGNAIFVYGDDYNPDKMDFYEASIFTSRVKKTQKDLLEKGISSDICSTTSQASELSLFINNLLSYLVMLLSSIALFIVFVITYVVLSKVYSSKKKDYEILRTLGVTQKDMKHIVNYEVLAICTGCLVIAYIAFLVMLYNITSLESLGKMKVGTTLIYIAVTFLFAYGIARRFNRKLFKFSVTKSMKGDGKHD